MTYDELLKYYSGLLIIQYRAKTKAIATIKLLVNSVYSDDLPREIQTCFDLDTAVGAQLDIIGRIVGVPRNIFGLNLVHTFFSFTDYSSGASIGFGDYSDSPYSEDLFYQYNLNAVYTLSDYELSTLIKLKIIANCKYTSLKDIKEALYANFAGDIDITDTGVMTATYTAKAIYTNAMTSAQFLGILPKPMGVALTITYT